MIDIETRMSQLAFANAIGLSRETISKAMNRGVLTKGGTAQQWIRELIDHYLEVAAGRGDGVLDLAAERAALAAAQRERIEVDLAERRGELFPMGALIHVLQDQAVVLRSKLLALPSRLMSLNLNLPRRTHEQFDDLVRECLTEISQTKFPASLETKIRHEFAKIHGQAIEKAEARTKPAKKAPLARRKRTPKRSASAQSAQGRRPRKPSGGPGKDSS